MDVLVKPDDTKTVLRRGEVNAPYSSDGSRFVSASVGGLEAIFDDIQVNKSRDLFIRFRQYDVGSVLRLPRCPDASRINEEKTGTLRSEVVVELVVRVRRAGGKESGRNSVRFRDHIMTAPRRHVFINPAPPRSTGE